MNSQPAVQGRQALIALHKDIQPTDVVWPAMKAQHTYWTEAAQYIKDTADTENLREGIKFFNNLICTFICLFALRN